MTAAALAGAAALLVLARRRSLDVERASRVDRAPALVDPRISHVRRIAR